MYDVHQKMGTFYHQHVRLPEKKRNELKDLRNINLDRLNQGLQKIGEKDGVEYKQPLRHPDQGSYSMHTMNKCPDDDYDIDVAIIFAEDALPSSPLEARKRIERAFTELGGNFKKPPKARTNAVTVWYAEGYHIDFAVYREVTDEYGDTLTEHAGAEWKIREPVEIKKWFNRIVKEKSPSRKLGATVEDSQFRRIVRLLKAFSKSRSEWDLPGGMIISKLASDHYRSDMNRDDISLYNTMQAIHSHLLINTHVYDPIYPDQELTYKQKFISQVEQFRDKLGEAITQLAVLFNYDCTEEQARKAWCWVFQHDFWCSDSEEKAEEKSSKSDNTSVLFRSPSVIREAPPFA